MAEQKPKDKCRICLKPFYPFPMGEKNGYMLESCRACGSVMTRPWVTQEHLDKFFGDVQPIATHMAEPDIEIDISESLIRKAYPGELKGKRFLDIANRQGYAVMAARRLHMEPLGISPHEFFTKFAQEVYAPELFKNISVQDYAASDPPKADFILAQETFTEQPDIEGYMAAVSRLLAPGGVMYVEEADGNSFNLPRLFAEWAYVEPPLNFVYYSKKGLTAVLNRHGLAVQKMFFTWKPMMRMVVVKQ
jgi:SAM-dependent methyltransferase